MDKRTAIGVTFILFLVSAWLIGIMMNLQYEGGGGGADLSSLAVVVTVLPFVMAGVIIYRGRTRMFLLLFSFALFWLITPIFFFGLGFLYISLIFLGSILLIVAFKKGYISSKKMAITTGIFLWLGAFIVYVYTDIYGKALRSPLPSVPMRPEEMVKGPSFVWDRVGVAVESAGGPGVFLLMVILILAMGLFLYQRMDSISPFSSRKEDEKKEVENDITSTVDRAITELHQGKDVESTILRCYQRMCIILEEEGVKNEDFMTPREFEKIATRKLTVPRSEISSIRGIFELAKYSSHSLSEKEKDRVLRDLKALREELV